ncbi:MAG: Crp/Fnr family transcriptional regulator [Chloroflexi bacterium]|nr:Crp/Fnr family transcriptional regulator [Chloroflexota bacterium]
MIDPTTLRQLAYLYDLEDRDLARVAERCTEQRFERGELILLEGAPCPGMYFVIQGRVKVFKLSPEGREQILRIMGPGETFNDVPAFDGGSNPASVAAMEPTTVGLIPSAEVERLVREYPQVAWHMLRLFAGRLRAFVDLVAELSLLGVEARVAKLLLVSSQNTDRSRFRITQQDMAAMVGTTREVVARALRSLEDRGAISREEGHLEIRDRHLLEAVSEGAVH